MSEFWIGLGIAGIWLAAWYLHLILAATKEQTKILRDVQESLFNR